MLTENTIEQSLIEQLVAHGYVYQYAPDIAPYSDNPQRESFTSVILERHFKKSRTHNRDTLLPKLISGEIRVNGFKN